VAGVPVALAILPAGTANLFATNLGIPKDLEEAVKIDGGVRKKTKRLNARWSRERSPFVYLGRRGDEHGESGSGDVGADRR
jgi:diacylglycerol kinase family enzyme